MARIFSSRHLFVWRSIFSLLLALAATAASGEPEKDSEAQRYVGDRGTVSSPEESRYSVRFQGKDYHTIYERQTDRGVPIDLYYYEIPSHRGVPAVKDGEKLWGRFARVPSVGYGDQSSVVWWHVWWSYENGRWLLHEAENIPPPGVLKSGGSTVREDMLKGAAPDSGESERRGKLGVTIQDLTPDLVRDLRIKKETGVLVVDVVPEGPAERAGIKRDDVIISYDGTSVMNVRHLAEMTGRTPERKAVQVKIVRDGREKTLTATIGPPGSATELPEKEINRPVKRDAPEKALPKKETKKPDVPKEKKQPTGTPPRDLGEL